MTVNESALIKKKFNDLQKDLKPLSLHSGNIFAIVFFLFSQSPLSNSNLNSVSGNKSYMHISLHIQSNMWTKKNKH